MSISGTPTGIAAIPSSRSCFSSSKYSGKDLLLLHVAGNAKGCALKTSTSVETICYAAKNGVGVEVEASSGERRSKPNKSSPKNVASVGIFKLKFPSSLVPQSLRSLLINPDVEVERHKEEEDIIDADIENALYKANWVERILELQAQWEKQKQLQSNEKGIFGDDGNGIEEGDGCCEVDYDNNEIDGFDFEGNDEEMDGERFSRLLSSVSWSDSRLFAKLAYLSKMAYAIPEIKTKDLKRYYGLEVVTSSLERKAEAAAIKDKLDQNLTNLQMETAVKTSGAEQEMENSGQKSNNLPRLSSAYEIAASASSYVQCKAKNPLAFASEPTVDDDASSEAKVGGLQPHRVNGKEKGTPPRLYTSKMAAHVAASTMTTVVAANEKQKQEAVRDLQSLQSSPCEWFICDDPSIKTRYFIIQGSDSLASWQTNLFFEPTKFEETDVLVHKGIYEAAKGIYEQFIPEINLHLGRYGNRAKFQFAGHSLGGSLSLMIHLMLIAREFLKPSTLLPIVTFGSPFVFCGGQRVLQELGLNEDHVHCVMMHRDIVPRAFSCNYPHRVAQLLKRLNGTFLSHPCLSKNHMLYTPMGKIFILQPDENLSPGHPFLPPGSGIYSLENTHCRPTIARAVRAFLNNPHPLETLSDLTAYGSEGTILRDHDSNNYLKAMEKVIREHKKRVFKKAREKNLLWPLLTSQSPHAWSHDRTLKEKMGS